MSKRKRKKKHKRVEPVISASVKDQLSYAIAVVHTVVDAINEDDEQHLATVLLEHALYPLCRVQEALGAAP